MNPATHHFIAQRGSAVLLIVLSLWFVSALKSLKITDPQVVAAWVQRPRVVLLLLLLMGALFYHASLGVQVVLEDYIPDLKTREQAIKISHWTFLGLGLLSGLFLLIVAALGLNS